MDKSYLVIKWVLINCIILMLSINVYGKNNPLSIRADINRVEEINEKDGYMEFKLNMNLRFENTGDKPLILLKPINNYIYCHGGVVIAKSKEEALESKYIYRWIHLPSNYDLPEYKDVAKNIDTPTPPQDYTLLIRPHEQWCWNTDVYFRINKDKYPSDDQLYWNQIRSLQQSVWVSLVYEIWPFDSVKTKKSMGKKLQKNWVDIGDLWAGDKYPSIVTTQPFELDLPSIVH